MTIAPKLTSPIDKPKKPKMSITDILWNNYLALLCVLLLSPVILYTTGHWQVVIVTSGVDYEDGHIVEWTIRERRLRIGPTDLIISRHTTRSVTYETT